MRLKRKIGTDLALWKRDHILDHSHCSMKDALAGGETEGRQQFQLPIC